MKLGLVGLPNVGKSTLFNAITQSGAEVANYPFCTISPNVGVVAVPDERLAVLAGMYNPQKVTPAVVEFVDIAGLVRGASKGEGLGNQFLAHIREVDAIVEVVRCFDDDDIVHVEGAVDPIRDIETIQTELVLADLESVDKRLDRARKMSKSGDARVREEAALLERMQRHLDSGAPIRTMELSSPEDVLARGMFLLTGKKILYAANIAEGDIGRGELPYVAPVLARAAAEGSEVLVISAKIESEIAAMEPGEKQLFLDELGIGQSGLDRLVSKCYALLNQISFLTAGPKEVRAWTIPQGAKAPQAAGVIHSDFERGFIRAEVVRYDDLIANNGMAGAKEKGQVRSEGKEYVMQDGDVVLFRFNV